MQHLRITNSLLAIVALILLGVIAWQAMRISGLNANLQQAQRTLDTAVERMAVERVKNLRREEMVATVQWLDEFYRAPEGLQRPDGLWRADARRVDSEAIGVWVLDVYLQSRLAGKSDADARQAIVDQIKTTDEWRQKHPKG